MGRFTKRGRGEGRRPYRVPAILLIAAGIVLLVAAVSLGKSGPRTDALQFAVDSSGTGAPPPPAPAPTPAPTPDTTPPVVAIAKKAAKAVPAKGATFSFSANEASHFICRVDSREFRPCTSPFKAPKLRPGHHVFSVQAIDAAGNPSPVTTVTFQVKKPARRAKHRH